MIEYIYLIWLKEFVDSNKNIYKIGKTTQKNFKRFNSYPNGSILITHSECNNCDIVEKNIIQIFKEKYILRRDFGYEYFEGNRNEMVDIIMDEIKKTRTKYDHNENLINKNKLKVIKKKPKPKPKPIDKTNMSDDMINETISYYKYALKKALDKNNKLYKKLADNKKNNIKIEESSDNKRINALNYVIKNTNTQSTNILVPINQNKLRYLLVNKLDFLEVTDIDIVEYIIHQYKTQNFEKYLSEIIISEVNNNDPTDQAIYTTDIKRIIFVVKYCTNNVMKWDYDKKGLIVSKILIYPIIDYLKKILTSYTELNSATIIYSDDLTKLTNYIKININDIKKNIIKYLAKAFCISKLRNYININQLAETANT